jgi:RNAse (barnase) inhibitor barstar
MEVLDVFKEINSQVNQLTKRQVQAFPESLKPKTQRDLVAEVGVDKAIESLNKTLEQKLGALEFVVQNLEQGQGNVFGSEKMSLTQSFQATINTGDLIPLWNGIVRSYKEIGLSRDSQNIIKVKIQDLLPNLDAMNYGLKEAIEYIFQQPFVSDQPRRGRRSGREKEAEEKGEPLNPRLLTENLLVILDYLRTLSLYQIIKQQVESGNLELISVDMMNSAYENIFNTLSSDRVKLLRQVAPRGVFGKSSIRNIPIGMADYRERLQALEEELGVKFPREYYDIVGSLPQDKVSQFLNDIRGNLHPQGNTRLARIQSYLRNITTVTQKIRDIKIRIEQARQSAIQLDHEIETLQTDPLDEVKDEPLLDEIEMKDEPVYPDANEYKHEDSSEEFKNALLQYDRDYKVWHDSFLENDRIRQHNNFAREWNEMMKEYEPARRMEIITQKERELNSIKSTIDALNKSGKQQEKKLRRYEQELEISKKNKVEQEDIDDLDALKDILVGSVKEQPLNVENLNLIRPAGRGKTKGNKVETRGMASMRKNYGYSDNEKSDSEKSDSESESDEEDPLHFDDRRNDNYYMKPAR